MTLVEVALENQKVSSLLSNTSIDNFSDEYIWDGLKN